MVSEGTLGLQLFATVEQGNAQAPGWYVSTCRTRREALRALRMPVRQQRGHLGRDAARGVQLRHDHGSGFGADTFQNQIEACCGTTASYALVGQPQTNGVVERFFGALTEQLVLGRTFDTLEDVPRPCVPSSAAATPIGSSKNTATSAATYDAAHTTSETCPWSHNPTECPRNRVRFEPVELSR
ncbi:MAG: hypothetical protein ACOCY0_01135 [Roseicyclus sp.]